MKTIIKKDIGNGAILEISVCREVDYDLKEYENRVEKLIRSGVESLKEIEVKRCALCGKKFIPQLRTDEIYCSNIYENGKTCKELGAIHVYMRDKKGYPYYTYRKIYKRKHAHKKADILRAKKIKDDGERKHIINSIEKNFNLWRNEAKNLLNQAISGDVVKYKEKMEDLYEKYKW